MESLSVVNTQSGSKMVAEVHDHRRHRECSRSGLHVFSHAHRSANGFQEDI